MNATHVHLTKAAIEALPTPPKRKRRYYYDSKTKGLAVAVTDRGTKSFVHYRWVAGRPERISLGRCALASNPGLTIEEARKAAASANLAIARGENPNQTKRSNKAELTLDELFKEYTLRHSEIHNRRPDKPKNNYRLYLAQWGRRRLSEIRRADVQALHARLGRDVGQVTANIAVKLLRSLFNRAIEWELWRQPNPVRIRMFPEVARDRFLHPDELPRFFHAVEAEQDPIVRDFIFMALLTGARRGNVLSMRFDQVSVDRAEWRIPVTKAGKPHVVPLLPEALEIVRRRKLEEDAKPVNERSKFLFPGRGKSGHLQEPKKGWRRILHRAQLDQLVDWVGNAEGWDLHRRENIKASLELTKALAVLKGHAEALGIDSTCAGLKDLRIHDLRRTLGSWQAATGASLSVIGRTLHHQNLSTTAIYARLNLDPVRDSMQKATGAIFAAAGLRQSAPPRRAANDAPAEAVEA